MGAGSRPRDGFIFIFLINSRQNDRMIFSAPRALHALKIIWFSIIILNNLSDICAHILIIGQNSAKFG